MSKIQRSVKSSFPKTKEIYKTIIIFLVSRVFSKIVFHLLPLLNVTVYFFGNKCYQIYICIHTNIIVVLKWVSH